MIRTGLRRLLMGPIGGAGPFLFTLAPGVDGIMGGAWKWRGRPAQG